MSADDAETIGGVVGRAEAAAPASINWNGFIVTYLGSVDLADWNITVQENIP